MEITIHRGSKEVGGTCIELQAGDSRIVLDVGAPLFDDSGEAVDARAIRRMSTEELSDAAVLPKVGGLFDPGHSPNAILLSHAHMDHTGLLGHTSFSIPVFASRGTSKMMLAGKLFAAQVELPRQRFREIEYEVPISIGDFTVTGFPVDHSIYGCLAFLIEAGGFRLFYTGDLRSHGRKPGMERRLIDILQDRRIDALLMEGTHFSFPDGELSTEYELESHITGLVRNCESLVLASFSPQHVDRLVAFIRSAKRTGRVFVADIYTAFVLHLLRNELKLPQPKKNGSVRVYVPNNLRESAHRSRRSDQIKRFKDAEITMSEIRRAPEENLMVFRASMLADFEEQFPSRTSCLYSRWHGYLEQPEWKTVQQVLRNSKGALHVAHTSGHIFSDDIVRFVREINPKTVIPVHTFDPERFEQHFENVVLLEDGMKHSLT